LKVLKTSQQSLDLVTNER
jgi:hypothetical protein